MKLEVFSTSNVHWVWLLDTIGVYSHVSGKVFPMSEATCACLSRMVCAGLGDARL